MERKVLRKWNNIIHRDLGYFFFGITLIYGLSGIALNHRAIGDWNASWIIDYKIFSTSVEIDSTTISENTVFEILKEANKELKYKEYYFPDTTTFKIFTNDGSIEIDTKTGVGHIETLTKRPVFHQVNFLHYNPNRWWTWFSDIYAFSLILLAITGLFVIRGKNGLKWRGLILASIGIIVPILFLLFS